MAADIQAAHTVRSVLVAVILFLLAELWPVIDENGADVAPASPPGKVVPPSGGCPGFPLTPREPRPGPPIDTRIDYPSSTSKSTARQEMSVNFAACAARRIF